MKQWKCRTAPTLGGGFAGTPESVWGTQPYNPQTDIDEPTVFFGLYGLPDFYALWRHKGKKAVLWAGSDIRHFIKGYWLDEYGTMKLCPKGLAKWLNNYCDNWVENEKERFALECHGITAKVCPSFLGDVNQYEVSFAANKKLYTSVSGDDFALYGWLRIPKLAHENPDVEFHLYGNTMMPPFPHESNVIVHGRVSQEEMNSQIKDMHGALRLTEFDGFSEILAKSILWGQHPVSLIEYPYMANLNNFRECLDKTEPNLKGREYYKQQLNQYPWNNNL